MMAYPEKLGWGTGKDRRISGIPKEGAVITGRRMKMETRRRRAEGSLGSFKASEGHRGGGKSGTLGLVPDETASHLHLQVGDGVRAWRP